MKQLTLMLNFTKAGNESLVKLGQCLPKTMEVLILNMMSEVTDEGVKGLAEALPTTNVSNSTCL